MRKLSKLDWLDLLFVIMGSISSVGSIFVSIKKDKQKEQPN